MTREEAIQILADLIDSPFLHTWEKQNKALHMAIEALSAPQTDLINRGRADAIEAIQNAYCKPCKERGDDYNEVRCRVCEYDNAIIQIDALPSAEAEWIPCSERLPDNDDWVLGTVRYWDKAEDPIDEAFYAVEHLFYDGKWRIAGGSEVDQYDDATVLAWQPMPEPYKGDVEKPKERKIPLYAYASWDRSEE